MAHAYDELIQELERGKAAREAAIAECIEVRRALQEAERQMNGIQRTADAAILSADLQRKRCEELHAELEDQKRPATQPALRMVDALRMARSDLERECERAERLEQDLSRAREQGAQAHRQLIALQTVQMEKWEQIHSDRQSVTADTSLSERTQRTARPSARNSTNRASGDGSARGNPSTS